MCDLIDTLKPSGWRREEGEKEREKKREEGEAEEAEVEKKVVEEKKMEGGDDVGEKGKGEEGRGEEPHCVYSLSPLAEVGCHYRDLYPSFVCMFFFPMTLTLSFSHVFGSRFVSHTYSFHPFLSLSLSLSLSHLTHPLISTIVLSSRTFAVRMCGRITGMENSSLERTA